MDFIEIYANFVRKNDFYALAFFGKYALPPKTSKSRCIKKNASATDKKIRLTLEKTALLMYVICREINFPFRELKTAELQHK